MIFRGKTGGLSGSPRPRPPLMPLTESVVPAMIADAHFVVRVIIASVFNWDAKHFGDATLSEKQVKINRFEREQINKRGED